MPRIKIDLPAHQLASFEIPVRISDINYGNHVGNDAFVSIIHESRMLWLWQHGYTELNFEGVGLLMSDIAIEFMQEVFFGETFTVTVFTGEISRVSFELYYELSVDKGSRKHVAAKAKTGMVCYNYELKKTASIPEKIRQLLAS